MSPAVIGVTDPSVRFLSHGRDYTLFLTSNAAVFTLQTIFPVSMS